MFALPPNNSSQSSTTFRRNFKISQSISLSTISGFLIHLFNKAYEKKGINLFWSVKKTLFFRRITCFGGPFNSVDSLPFLPYTLASNTA